MSTHLTQSLPGGGESSCGDKDQGFSVRLQAPNRVRTWKRPSITESNIQKVFPGATGALEFAEDIVLFDGDTADLTQYHGKTLTVVMGQPIDLVTYASTPKLASREVPRDTLELFSDLLREARVFEINPHIVERARLRYASAFSVALTFHDSRAAIQLYEEVSNLPQTKTIDELSVQGFQLDGHLFNGNDNLVICFKGTVPYLLKSLRSSELNRWRAFSKHNVSNRYLITIELVEASDRCTHAIMPLHPLTLEHLILDQDGALRLWSQMSEALRAIHKVGFAHADMKPSNICITSSGDFVLIDLGSIVEFGLCPESTAAFIPRGIEMRAGPRLDFWMLAATIANQMSMKGWGEGAHNPTQDSLRDFLKTANMREICEYLETI
eukprot:TRINITY_DN3692_c0_g1_i1.p1 TRINITY_DN3692_c0_g1~~TRINITY_DN3692_c0_g1_i1.p1  ORF type:complete len:382 (-),score=18.58 TRINITY_DN3692_c0_g1_i1:13-1158(-)